jgi:hypothetical protein
MIGALLTEDSTSVPPDGLNQVSPKFNPIFDILAQLGAEYREDVVVQAVHGRQHPSRWQSRGAGSER